MGYVANIWVWKGLETGQSPNVWKSPRSNQSKLGVSELVQVLLMKLQRLINEFWQTDRELKHRIDRYGEYEDLLPVDTKLTDLIGRIKDYEAQDISSLREKFTFFAGFIKDSENGTRHRFAFDALTEILNRDLDERLFETDRNQANSSGVIANKRTEDEMDSVFKTISVFDLVGQSRDRISIIDDEFRYVNTSPKNGDFYNRPPGEIIGKHVGEIIGENRFEGRAKRFLEKTLNGKRQHYFHDLEINGRQRIMSCLMLPLHEAGGGVCGSMVTMEDITGHVSDPRSLKLEEITIRS